MGERRAPILRENSLPHSYRKRCRHGLRSVWINEVARASDCALDRVCRGGRWKQRRNHEGISIDRVTGKEAALSAVIVTRGDVDDGIPGPAISSTLFNASVS